MKSLRGSFRRALTFNVSDSSLVRTKGGRIAILLGVEERCDVIVKAMARTKVPMGPTDMVRHLGPLWPYSYTDIRTAMFKLAMLGVLEHGTSSQLFRLKPQGKKLWDSRGKKR